MNKKSKDLYAYLVAGFAGFIVVTGVSASTGLPVAWATPVYFWFGWPVMCAAIYLIARVCPDRPWRWTLGMMLGQVFASILYGNGAVVPVAMVYVTLLSAPQFFAGVLGARAGSRHMASATETSQEQDRL